jgi:glyoxylase I family protein
MRPRSIHHVSVNVANVPRAVAFYTQVVGGVLRQDRPDLGIDGAWIDLGDQQLHLIGGTVPPDHGQHFAIRVDDLDDVVQELRRKQVAVSDPVAIGTGRQAFMGDPDGNSVELHEART